MNTQKLSALLFLVCFYSTITSMEIEPYKKTSPSCVFTHNPIVSLIQTSLQDVQQEIVKYILPYQWWYLQKSFQHNNWVNLACFNNTGTLLVTASGDKTARMFDVQKKKEVASFQHNDSVRSVCFNNTGTLLATASGDKTARVFDVQEKKEVASFQHNNSVRSVCFNNTGTLLATASDDKTARMFDVQKKKEVASFQHNDSVRSVCFNNTGTLLATASDDKTARMFARYDDYTFEQLILKKAFNTWLLIKKPDKKIDSLEKLLKDIALKHDINHDEEVAVWKTFPEDMQAAIWRTMSHMINTYGK